MEIRLSAFADEASADLLQQIETLNRERIPLIELRGVNGKNVAELSTNPCKSSGILNI